MKSLLLSLLLLAGCSSHKAPRFDDQELVSIPSAKWFSANSSHSLWDKEGRPQSHLYFDVAPEFDANERKINVLIMTPRSSEHAYDVDLSSGQRHYTHSYCSQNDIWGEGKDSYGGPKIFSLAVVPRTMDQLGLPQKVVVWSGGNWKGSLDQTYYRVKLIGAYVEQSCPSGNCQGKDNWVSRLVWIAVDGEDPAYDDVQEISDFVKKYNWNETRAHLQNIDGRNFIGDRQFPFLRIRSLVPYAEAVKAFRKHSLTMDAKGLEKIRSACHGLYDRLWRDVGKERPEDKVATTPEELKEKLQAREELRKQGKPSTFGARFREFTQKYADEFGTCAKHVYHGNVNQDREAFWFLSFAGIYFRLHKEGHYFDCRKKAWNQNVFDVSGKVAHDLKQEISECTDKDIDQAMNYMPSYLKGLRGSPIYYRFVEYDNHPFGTHSKLYSWVRTRTRRFDCSSDPNSGISSGLEILPEDISWKKRDAGGLEEQMKIIY